MTSPQSEYRPEQFKARDLIWKYLKTIYPDVPLAITLEYPVADWQSFGIVEGVELRGMPTLDVFILLGNLKIGVELNGGSHRPKPRRLSDENKEIILNAKWGKLLFLVEDDDDSLWTGKDDAALAYIHKVFHPYLKTQNLGTISVKPDYKIPDIIK